MRKRKLKNLLNPTPAQIKHRAGLWEKALIENPRKATGEMYSMTGGRCCLAVAQDVARQCGVDVPENYSSNGGPHMNVEEFFGWSGPNQHLVYKDGREYDAMCLNDGSTEKHTAPSVKGCSHKTIAACVRRTFIEPKKEN